MRIVHYREAFSVLSETFIYEYYRQHRATGLDCSFFTFQRVDEAGRPADNVRVLSPSGWTHPLGFVVRAYGALPKVPRSERLFPLYRRSLQRALAAYQPDLIHAHFGPSGWIAHGAARRLGMPTVITFYGNDSSELPRKRRWRRRYAEMFGYAGMILALSEEMRQRLIDIGAPASRTAVVHLSRDLRPLQLRQRSMPLKSWLSVGRLVEKKGHADAIEAVGRLIDRGRDITLDIIGEGPLAGELQRLIDARGLAQRVRLLGSRPSEAVLDAMRAADGFFLCSKTASSGDREGTPTVLVEAQALGLPCVTTDHAGIPEMVPPTHRAALAPEGDVTALSDRLERLLASSDEQNQARCLEARRHVEEHFSVERQAERLTEVYADVIARHRAR